MKKNKHNFFLNLFGYIFLLYFLFFLIYYFVFLQLSLAPLLYYTYQFIANPNDILPAAINDILPATNKVLALTAGFLFINLFFLYFIIRIPIDFIYGIKYFSRANFYATALIKTVLIILPIFVYLYFINTNKDYLSDFKGKEKTLLAIAILIDLFYEIIYRIIKKIFSKHLYGKNFKYRKKNNSPKAV